MAAEFDDTRDFAVFVRDSKTLRNGNGYATRWSEQTMAALRSAGVMDRLVDGLAPPTTDKLWLDKNSDPAVPKEWDPLQAAWVPLTNERVFGRTPITELSVTGGTGDALVATASGLLASDRLYTITPTASNTGATTIQIAGVGTYPVAYQNGAALQAGEMVAGTAKTLHFRNSRFEVFFFPRADFASAAQGAKADAAVPTSTKGAASGVASLNAQALVNDTQNRLRDTVGNSLNPVLSWRGYTELATWTVTGGTLTNSNGNLAVAASGGTGYLQSPVFTGIAGLSARYVAIRHKLVSGTDRLRVYWRTASHGFTGSYNVDGTPEAAGLWRTTVIDMWNPTAGGTDWRDNTITQLRFDGMGADGSSIEIAWIAVLADNPARGDLQNDIRYLRKLSSGELSLADSAAIRNDGNIADATSNTAEISTLLASLPTRGGSLKIPAGTFTVNCGSIPTITNKHISIAGLGLGVSEFLVAGSTGSLFAVSQNDHALNTTFQDFSVRKHSDASTSGTMLDITYPAKTASQLRTSQVRNIQCRGHVEVGTTQFQGLVRVTNAWHPFFENLDFEGIYGANTAAATVVLDQRCSLVTAMNVKGTWVHAVIKNQAGYGSEGYYMRAIHGVAVNWLWDADDGINAPGFEVNGFHGETFLGGFRFVNRSQINLANGQLYKRSTSTSDWYGVYAVGSGYAPSGLQMTNFQMFGFGGAAGGLAVGLYSSGTAAIQAESNIRMNGMTRGVDLANSSTGKINFGKYNVTTPTVSIPANATVTTFDFTA